MKSRLLVALLSVSSTAVFAQDLEVETTEVQVPGMTVKLRVQQPMQEAPPPPNQGPRQRGPTPPPVQVVGVDTFDLGFELEPQETLRLISPEGAHADIWADDGTYLGGYDVPCEVPARAGQFYRVVMSDSSGLIFDRKVELRRYNRTNVSFRGGRREGRVDFPALLEAVNAEAFGTAKLDVLRTANARLTVDQVGQLLELFSFSSEKVTVVEIAAPRLLDRQNAFKILGHFDFDSDKKKVKAILAR
ncbi:MAG: DUF4476 domain-containing protein [Archangium sp.]|nr:DUF4476 domain-containing protein [Archangium sp.]